MAQPCTLHDRPDAASSGKAQPGKAHADIASIADAGGCQNGSAEAAKNSAEAAESSAEAAKVLGGGCKKARRAAKKGAEAAKKGRRLRKSF